MNSECSVSYLSKPHAVPLVGRLLRLGGVHQLEARLILLMEVSILTATTKLRRIFI